MKITTDYLLSLEACKSGIDAFSNLFPGGEAELNSENLSKARCGGLDIIWLIERIADQATLAKLSKDKSAGVRCGVAWNPNAPLDVLAKLSKDEDYLVCEGVAANPSTPQGTTNEELAR